MKKLLLLSCICFCSLSIKAQTPNKISYQAVIRDATNNLVVDTQIGMQVSILEASATGTSVYVETHTASTNSNGILSIEIGAGTVVSGDFTMINWGNNTFFVKTDTDINGGTNYTITTTSQLLSVPYALHAKTATTVTTPALMEPHILGVSSQASSGRFSFNGKVGWEAANEMCKASYPNEPFARAFTNEQITEAITIGSYSDNTNYDTQFFWAITSSAIRGNTFNTSAGNNGYNLGFNSGDIANGVRGRIIFDYIVPGNGGGVTQARFFDVQQEIFLNLTYPCMCGTYKPATTN